MTLENIVGKLTNISGGLAAPNLLDRVGKVKDELRGSPSRLQVPQSDMKASVCALKESLAHLLQPRAENPDKCSANCSQAGRRTRRSLLWCLPETYNLNLIRRKRKANRN